MYTFGFHLFSLYTGELRFGQTMWDKTQILLGTSWGTHWKQVKKTKNPYFPPSPLKKK
jgi:hypothetical protein